MAPLAAVTVKVPLLVMNTVSPVAGTWAGGPVGGSFPGAAGGGFPSEGGGGKVGRFKKQRDGAQAEQAEAHGFHGHGYRFGLKESFHAFIRCYAIGRVGLQSFFGALASGRYMFSSWGGGGLG